MKRSSLLLFRITPLILLFVSCQTDKKQMIKPEESIMLSGKPLDIASYGFPFITILDKNLLIRNVSDDSGIFQLYETDSFKLISKFGTLGQGPHELGVPTWAAKKVGSNFSTSMFEIHDVGTRSLITIQTDNSKKNLNPQFQEKPLPKNTIDLIQKVILDNDSILVYQPESAGRMIFSKKDRGVNKVIPYEADTDFQMNQDNLWQIFDAQYAVHTDLSLIVSALGMLGQIDFYNFSGELVKSVLFDDFNHKSDKIGQINLQNGELRLYAYDIEANSESIYILVIDRSLEQVRSKTFTDRSRVLKFDWEGNYLKEYILDHFATSIAVDEIKSQLYTYNFFVEENSFQSYSLN
jgi:hypothetical protein